MKYPTLEWFLELKPEQQEEIWKSLLKVLRWRGWFLLLMPTSYRTMCLKEFFDTLERHGACWEEYT